MPGICGFITRDPDVHVAATRLDTMLRTMTRGEADVQGHLSDAEHGVHVGWAHRQDSVVVRSDEACTLVLCGEHFDAGQEGRAWSAAGTCLLRSIERDADAFVRSLNGWFAGVIVDRRAGRVYLFNDRYGMHRLHYWRTPDLFLFSSEATPLLGLVPDARAFDEAAVGQYLAFGTVFGGRTLFRGLGLLPGGSCWRLDRAGALKAQTYFVPEDWASQPPLPRAEFDATLADTLRDILPPYFTARSAVGLSLTGGLDTRILAAGMPASAGSSPAYTYGGAYRECYDVDLARRVASTCGLTHHVLPLEDDFFRNYGEYVAQTTRATEGTLDLMGAHEIYFSRLASRLSPIRLTGNYGSEILRSVTTFKHGPVDEYLIDGGVPAAMRAAREEHARLRALHPVTFAAFCEVPWHLAGRRLAAESVLVLRSPYTDNRLVSLLYRAPQDARESVAASLTAIRALNPALAALPTDMAHGGVPPAPAYRRLSRYALFKAEWYYGLGMPHWLVSHERRLRLHLLEPLFLGSHKIEHYRLWFNSRLKGFVLDVLSGATAASRSYLRRDGLSRLVDDFASDRRNCAAAVSRLANLELVQRLLLDDHAR